MACRSGAQAVVLCHLLGYSLKERSGTVLSGRHGRIEIGTCDVSRGLLAGSTLAVVVAAVPRVLQAATIESALNRVTVPAAIASLATRAMGTSWGFAIPGLTAGLAAALLVAAVGLGQPDTPKLSPKIPEPIAKSEPQKPRLDSEGVELPRGAIARLGSNRFRHIGTPMTGVAFSPDGKLLATGDDRGVSVFATQTGQRVQRFRLLQGTCRACCASSTTASNSRSVRATGIARRVSGLLMPPAVSIVKTKFTGKTQIFVIDVTADGNRVLIEDRFRVVPSGTLRPRRKSGRSIIPRRRSRRLTPTAKRSWRQWAEGGTARRDDGQGHHGLPKPARVYELYEMAASSADGKLALPPATAMRWRFSMPAART